MLDETFFFHDAEQGLSGLVVGAIAGRMGVDDVLDGGLAFFPENMQQPELTGGRDLRS